MTHCL